MLQDAIRERNKNGAAVTHQTSGYVGATTPPTTLHSTLDPCKCIVPNNQRYGGCNNGKCYQCTWEANGIESFVGPGGCQTPNEYDCTRNRKCKLFSGTINLLCLGTSVVSITLEYNHTLHFLGLRKNSLSFYPPGRNRENFWFKYVGIFSIQTFFVWY